MQLSPRQADVLHAIQVSIELRGIPPTVRELAEALELESTNAVAEHLAALERKGFIRREPCRARAIVLTDTGRGEP